MKKIIGDCLIVINILALPIAFALSAIVGEVEIFSTMGLVRYSWFALLFLPIPLITLLYSVLLKKSGLKYKDNLIIALVLSLLLSCYGLFWVDLFNVHSYDVKIISDIEEKVFIDLPDEVKIATDKYDNYELSYAKILYDEEKIAFETGMILSDFWDAKINDSIIDLLPDNTFKAELINCEYFLFYNHTLNQYNKAPINPGNYECVFLAYDNELSRLIILNEYELLIV